MRTYRLNTHRFHPHTEAHLLLSGNSFFDALSTRIAEAKHRIHLQYYIFDEDYTGRTILDGIVSAAQRGVRVYVVVDGYASSKISEQTIAHLRGCGIFFKEFSPIKSLYLRIGRRLHHKIAVVDNEWALIGGINIADKYSGYGYAHPWLDFAVMVRGSVVNDVHEMVQSYIPRRFRDHCISKHFTTPQLSQQARLLQNDWRRGYIEISAAYRQAIRTAQKELIIAAAYFFPNNSMLRLIKKAAQRGVRVVFFTGSSSDVIILKPAIRYLYHYLLRHGVEVYEWQPTVMHGKLLIKDGHEVNIGSYNLNALSDFGSTEANLQIIDSEFCSQVMKELNFRITNQSKRIDQSYFVKTITPWRTAYRWASYHLFRFALKLLFVVMQRSRFKG